MTQSAQVQLAAEKVSRWANKHAHATAMLAKWKHQLSVLEAKAGKPTPTATKLPPLMLVQSAEQAAMADISRAADEAGGKVLPLKNGKAKPKKTPPKK